MYAVRCGRYRTAEAEALLLVDRVVRSRVGLPDPVTERAWVLSRANAYDSTSLSTFLETLQALQAAAPS